jgi:hypothetical protein
MYIRPARLVVAAFVATLLYGLLLLAAFEPDVQTVAADVLVERRDDARAFLIADFVFIALYAILSPLAQRRFGRSLGAPFWPAMVAPWILAAAGVVDAVENVLLLSATDAVSEDAVRVAHALEIPKVILFVLGTLLSVLVLVRAVKTLRSS